MELRFIAPTVRQVGNSKNECESLSPLFVLKAEKFAVQMELLLTQKTWISLNKDVSIPWSGLSEDLIRIEIKHPAIAAKIAFEGAVIDDDNIPKKDRILNQTAQYLPKGYHNLWIDLTAHTAGVHQVPVKIYQRTGFEDEQCILEEVLTVEVADVEATQEQTFFLDLWQHLTSLQRYYGVELFSDEHFRIIDQYLGALEEANQKVCDLIISDYSWAGQDCYRVDDNRSSLFEYNIIGVSRKKGDLVLDFAHMDRYLELCQQHHMLEEIDLFGILGNWAAYSFGTPIADYKDPIRIRLYDEDKQCHSYIRTKAELKDYISQVFSHLQALGLWDKVRIVGDEPQGNDRFAAYEKFLQSCSQLPIAIKYAVLHGEFLNEYQGSFENFSIHSSVFIENAKKTSTKMTQNLDKMTWYTCCFPENLNQFIRSPLLESYLVGYYTYAFGLKGFLRWNFCLWPEGIDTNVRYKPEKWAAGDMFFVYPGKAGQPEYSLRYKNLILGIQAFNQLKALESKIAHHDIVTLVEEIIGDIQDLDYIQDQDKLIVNYTNDFNQISEFKRKLIKLID